VNGVGIVTGASSGLGLALSSMLIERGMHVVGVSRRTVGDASQEETAKRAIAEAERYGQIHLLVNAAGVGVFGAAGSYDENSIRRVLDANLVSTIVFCDALLPRFQREGGTIVNILSTAALVAKPDESVYCAAKWGARGYTEVLRAESKGTKARVMSVAPGGMNTPFWDPPREDFMDPREVAAVIVDAIERPVYVAELVIQR
jgi:short-subunit dehydrogenase